MSSDAINEAAVQPDFLADLKRALLAQPERPSYKRARAAVKAAVNNVDDIELRQALTQQLPAVLADLKDSLARKEPPSEGAAATTGRAKRHKVSAPEHASAQPGFETEQRYKSAVEALSASSSAAAKQQALLARMPPDARAVAALMPSAVPPSALDITRAVDTGCRLIAAACGSNAAPAVTGTLAVLQRHVSSMSNAMLVQTDATSACAHMQASQLSAEEHDAHAACCNGIHKLAAILPLHTAAAAGSVAAPLLLQQGTDADCSDTSSSLRWQLAYAGAQAHVCSWVAAGAEGPLTRAMARRLMQSTTAHVRSMLPLHTDGMAHAGLQFIAKRSATALLGASGESTVAQLAWLALHAVLTAHARVNSATFAHMVVQRQCARIFAQLQCSTDAQRAKRALDGCTCESAFSQWLRAAAKANSVAQKCLLAAQRHGNGATGAVAAVMHDLSDVEFDKLVDLHQSGSVSGAEQQQETQADAVAARDEDLFMLDIGSEATAFDGSWAHVTSDGSESEGSEGALPDQEAGPSGGSDRSMSPADSQE